MASATLQAIQTKVRRLTRSPSTSQLTDAQLNEYINTFILYDLPEHLRLFSLRSTFTFYTQPGVDSYSTTTTNANDPLYNFKNKYIATHPPIFIAGLNSFFTQKRDIFYGMYPQTSTIADTLLRGNGTTGPFIGTVVAHPMIQGDVIFNCLDELGNAMILTDEPTSNEQGNLVTINYQTNTSTVYGTINYISGAFDFSFPSNTQSDAPVYVENLSYMPGKPIAMLYYDDTFTIRPVPDKSYSVQMEVDVRPTELLLTDDVPFLEQWWQYIAYGASVKIFQDRFDFDSVQMVMPEFKQQERMVLRTTLTQQANERTTTIYTTGKTYGMGGWWGMNWPY
jgi:hypothetical protein